MGQMIFTAKVTLMSWWRCSFFNLRPWEKCCILCYRHRPGRLMRQLSLGMHHERLRELQNNLTEQGTGVGHQHQLPPHPRQRVQWLHRAWLSNRVLTLKSL
jgi:hypothetical protein